MAKHGDNLVTGTVTGRATGTTGERDDWLSTRLKRDAEAMGNAPPGLNRQILAAVEREAARRLQPAASRASARSGWRAWLPALASFGAAATVAAILLIPATPPVVEDSGTPLAGGLIDWVPERGPRELAEEGRELEALARQPLEQELAAVDAVISEFGEVMSKDFGALARLTRDRDDASKADAGKS